MRSLLSILLLFLGLGSFAQNTVSLDSTVLTIDTVITGLNVPWEIQWGPDNAIWTTEREGIVSRINPVTGTKTQILDITSTVTATGESGLLGLVHHPQYPDSNYVYLVYTFLGNGVIKERLVKYAYNGSNLVSPQILLDSLTGASTHNGSRLIIGTDNKLYMTTGDAQFQALPQDVTSLNGKLLRFNLDGSIPSDNPIPGSLVYSWGHRNAQGLTLGPNGAIYSSEHGPNTDDELNLILAGGNYGWPSVRGFCDQPGEISFCADSNVIEPVTNFEPNRTVAASDIIYYNHPAIPEWQGAIIMAVLKDKQIRVMHLATPSTLASDVEYLTNQFGRIRDVLAGPDGSIYLATNGASWGNSDPNTHTILRLRNNNYQAGPLQANAGNDTSVCAGGSLTLGATLVAVDGTPPYSYQWTGGNLACDTCANPTVTVTDTTTFVVTVTDANNDTSSDTVNITTVPISLDTTSDAPFLIGLGVSTVSGSPILIDINGTSSFDTVFYSFPNGSSDTFEITNFPFTDTMGNNYITCTTDEPVSYCDVRILVCGLSVTSCTVVCKDTTLVILSSGLTKLPASDLQLYPNPTNGQITIKIQQQSFDVKVFDQTGRLVMQEQTEIGMPNHSIDLSEQTPGIYFMQLNSGKEQVVKKIVLY